MTEEAHSETRGRKGGEDYSLSGYVPEDGEKEEYKQVHDEEASNDVHEPGVEG